MSTLLKADVDRTEHVARIGRLLLEAAHEIGLCLPDQARLDELSAEMDKCRAFGCFDQLRKMTSCRI